MPQKDSMSLRELGKKYGVSYQTISNFKKEGVDVLDEKAVRERIELNESVSLTTSFPLSVPSPNHKPGLAGSIERLQQAEIASHQDYLKALKEQPEQAGKCLKAWLVLAEQLRKISVDNPSIEKENSQSISKSQLATELGSLFRDLRQDLDSLPRRLSMFAGKSKAELEREVQSEVDKILDSLYSCTYLSS
jgi:hypothetical protein